MCQNPSKLTGLTVHFCPALGNLNFDHVAFALRPKITLFSIVHILFQNEMRFWK